MKTAKAGWTQRRWMLLGLVGLGLLLWFWFCLPRPLFIAPYSTVLLDRQEELLGAAIAPDGQWRFPPDTDAPDKFVQAVVAFEDKRFNSHWGVDFLAIGRAFKQNIRAKRVVSGGSTLTMQVIRLARKNKSRTVPEKIIEMILAVRLELTTSKSEIFRLYAAHAPFGGNVVGLEAAAWRYYGRSPEHLSWGEAATLAVLPNSPALIHPGRNRTKLEEKRNALLDRLAERGVINVGTAGLAKAEPLPEVAQTLPMEAPHLLARVRLEQGQLGRIESRFHTTLDQSMQIRASFIVARHAKNLAGNGVRNAAALILDVEENQVLAYVGNAAAMSDREAESFVDIVPAPRSSGSLLKPILYAAMLENGEILPEQLVPDIPTRLGGFAPENASRTYQGAVPAALALSRSLNIPAVRMLQDFGVDRFYGVLKNVGMRTLNRPAENYGLSLILGGAETSLWDMASIYAGMARTVNIFFRPQPAGEAPFESPVFLQTALKSGANPGKAQAIVLGPASCFLTLQAMREVIRPESEGDWQMFASASNVAWKTGTSFGQRDGWAVGVTPKYVVAVWVGNADGEGRPGLTGIAAAAPILFDLFGLVKRGPWFETPEAALTEVNVCAKSGHRAGPDCQETKTALIPLAGLRQGPCPYCRTVHLDRTQRWQAHVGCESRGSLVESKRFVLPPTMEWFYRQRHADYQPMPPLRQDCLAALERPQKSLSLISPNPGAVIFVPREIEGDTGRTVFQAAHRQAGTVVYWHLDNEYLGSTQGVHQMALAPKPGQHRIVLVDERGERVEMVFTVLGRDN